MSFVKLIRSDATRELIRHPNEFALLALIAERTKRTDCFSADGLSPGEAMIGAGDMDGMSVRQYRTAKERLKKWRFADFTPTNRGTIARVVSKAVFDPNIVINDTGKVARTQRIKPRVNSDSHQEFSKSATDLEKVTDRVPTEQTACSIGGLQEDSDKSDRPPAEHRQRLERINSNGYKVFPKIETGKKKEEVISSFSNEKEPSADGLSKNYFRFKIKGQRKTIIKLCREIDQLSAMNGKHMNPWSFVQQKANQRGHPKGIIDALKSVIKAWSIIDEPWAYAEKIFQVRSPNYNERDAIAKNEELKKAWISADIMAMIYERNIGRRIYAQNRNGHGA